MILSENVLRDFGSPNGFSAILEHYDFHTGEMWYLIRDQNIGSMVLQEQDNVFQIFAGHPILVLYTMSDDFFRQGKEKKLEFMATKTPDLKGTERQKS